METSDFASPGYWLNVLKREIESRKDQEIVIVDQKIVLSDEKVIRIKKNALSTYVCAKWKFGWAI